MKKFLLAFFVALSPLVAQQSDLQKDAMRAFQENDYRTAKSLFQTILSTDPKNTVALNYLRLIAKNEKTQGGNLEVRLRQVMIPKVEFSETSVRETVAFVTQQVKALTNGQQKVNVVWMAPADFNPPVTLSLQNVPASEALKYIASIANLKLSYDAHALTIRPLQEVSSPAPPAGAPESPQIASGDTAAPKVKPGTSAMETSLSKVVLPKAEFNDVSAREAVNYIAQRVKALTDGKQILNIVWMLPAGTDPTVTLDLQNIPASVALSYIAATAKLQLDYGVHALTIRPAQ